MVVSMRWKRFVSRLWMKNNWLTALMRLEFLPALTIPTSSATRIPSTTNSPTLSALSPNTLREGMSSSSSPSTRPARRSLMRPLSGMWLFKVWKDYLPFTKCTFSTETSSVPISSWPRIDLKSNWQIWMCRLSVQVEWLEHKLEHHIMPALRCGKRSLTVWNVIFGLWDVFSTKWLHWDLLSSVMISNLWRGTSFQGSTSVFLCNIRMIWKISSGYAWKLIQEIAFPPMNCLKMTFWRKEIVWRINWWMIQSTWVQVEAIAARWLGKSILEEGI